ncbi:MAG: hypothetical protein JO092_04155 [Candidatus Eremiobacteraeota bacterium]|nr:hypothetical protein [Candidatus Eremiobacteraeota bacterium]
MVRVDDASIRADAATFFDDLQVLIEAQVKPIVVAHEPAAARTMVRSINRSANALRLRSAARMPPCCP